MELIQPFTISTHFGRLVEVAACWILVESFSAFCIQDVNLLLNSQQGMNKQGLTNGPLHFPLLMTLFLMSRWPMKDEQKVRPLAIAFRGKWCLAAATFVHMSGKTEKVGDTS